MAKYLIHVCFVRFQPMSTSLKRSRSSYEETSQPQKKRGRPPRKSLEITEVETEFYDKLRRYLCETNIYATIVSVVTIYY